MDEFLEWPGWAGVSAIAQILSLATLLIAVWRFVVQRRQMPLFSLAWDFIGTVDVRGTKYHLVEFRNVGRGAGEFFTFHLCGARAELTENFLAPSVLGSGESFKMLITSPDLGAAWARWSVRTPDHRSRFRFRWAPLIRSGVIADGWNHDFDAWESRSYYEMMRDAVRPRPVGPGGVPTGIVTGNSPNRLSAILQRGESTETYFSVFAGTDSPPKLAYVPQPS